jgi:5-methylthioadenosine/S-adenosylhomocysteine deaminase
LPEANQVDYADVALLPGFINTHTHLELHGFRGQLPEAEFFTWMQLMRAIRETTPQEEGAPEGLRETWRCGTTTVADTGTSGATVRAVATLGGRGIYYQEAIGPDPARCEEAFAELTRTVQRLQDEAPASAAIGVSPHAPYTVSPELLERAVAFARAEKLPLASHLAESSAEAEFVSRGSGPFAESRHSRGIPMPPAARSPVEYAARAGLLGPDFLAIHAVRTDPDDVATLAESGCAVAVCPRSNLRHGHGNPPLRALLEAGLRVGLGTDSVASVESLDLLAEARAAKGLAGLTAEEALRLLTVDGARSLGMESEIGSLEVGKWADFVAVKLDPGGGTQPTDVAARVLASDPSSIVATYVGGRRVHPHADA